MLDHTKLRAFQIADEIAVMIYVITRTFPKDEIYGLTSQMRRAAVSMPSNIVEGNARESRTEYLSFLEIAFGSLRELHYQFYLASWLGYVSEPDAATGSHKLEESEKVLVSMIRSLRKS